MVLAITLQAGEGAPTTDPIWYLDQAQDKCEAYNYFSDLVKWHLSLDVGTQDEVWRQDAKEARVELIRAADAMRLVYKLDSCASEADSLSKALREMCEEWDARDEAAYEERMILKYGGPAAVAIMEGKVYLGMKRGALIESWGKPDKINTSVGQWGRHEQFVYGLGQYVYVKNGKVTSWQQ